MSDSSVTLNPGSDGESVATHLIGGKHHQIAKLSYGNADTATLVEEARGLPTLEAAVIADNSICEFLKDGTNPEMGGTDHSSTPASYKLAPAADEVYYVNRLIIQLLDESFDYNEFGAEGALSNGIRLAVYRGGSIVKFLDGGLGFKTNRDFRQFCYDATIEDYGGSSGLEVLTARFTMARAFGGPLKLDGAAGEDIRAIVSDDLSGVTSFEILVQGRKAV